MRPLARRTGFTIIELVVMLGVLGLAAIFVGEFSVSIFRTTRTINATLNATEQARRAVLNFTDEIRTAAISSTGAYPLAEAGAASITFYSDIDQDSYVERLRYFVQGTTLKRGYLKPSGSPLAYVPANESVTDSVQFVTNTSDVFSYYDTNYNGQTDPLSLPPNIPSVRLVRIKLQIDQNTAEPPGPYELSSEVSIRSLKDNL